MTGFDHASLVSNLPTSPGVYRMLSVGGDVLYVGKARNLRKRVQSYFRRHDQTDRIDLMVRQVANIEITVTHTEREALLLELNLIKSLQPRYNVQLRDDKSYPYIFVSDTQEFPRIGFYRGAKREKGRYFGPFPSSGSVRESLHLLQKTFLVRQCEDSFFRNRSRPCLQYQIKRCSAPCVGFIDRERYQQDLRHALMFLEGSSHAVIAEMIQKMEAASAHHDYETAAIYRDRIRALKHIQEKQYISGKNGDADVLAVATVEEAACVEVTYIRHGRNLGSKSFFPKIGADVTPEAILGAFLPQYYLSATGTTGRTIPPQIYLNQTISDKSLLEKVFAQQARKKIRIVAPARGAPRHWVQMAEINATDTLRRWRAGKIDMQQRFEALRDALALDVLPERIECFDISHTMGEAAVAACVVFDRGGPAKSDYRRFNIAGIEPGDDYAAIAQALTRRLRRVKDGEGKLPDLLFIDGGKGQLSAAEAVLQELQIDGLRLIAIAKGPERKPGKEQLFLSGAGRPTILPSDSPALHLIQQIRDEAHRFAIAGHRQRRGRARTTSSLELIPGIGSKRRQALLKNFGGLQGLTRAGVEDIARVPGISQDLAQRIYDSFHRQDT